MAWLINSGDCTVSTSWLAMVITDFCYSNNNVSLAELLAHDVFQNNIMLIMIIRLCRLHYVTLAVLAC